MTIISPSDLTLLRSRGHKTSTYISFNNPETIFTATLSIEPDRFSNTISFNSGSGNISMIRADMDVFIGSIGINSSDHGIVRLRSFNTSDGGVTGTLKLSANNWDFALGDTISIRLNFRLNPRFPKITGDALTAIFHKDEDVAYTNEHQNLAPVLIAGGNRAFWLDDATINPHLENSYTMSPGATITTYGVTALYVTGIAPTISINGSTGIGTITFNSTGQCWIAYSIIDSNGTEQVSYRFYRIHDDNDMPMVDVGITSVTGDFSSGGYSATIKPYGSDTGLNDIPDETQVIIWQDAIYGTTEKSITILPDNSNVLISGHLRKETVTRNLTDGTGDVSFQVNTLQQLMSNHFQFSMSIEARPDTPTKWYQFRNELTTLRGVHSFWKYQSTIMEICDVIGLDTDTDMLRPYVELGSGNLFTIVDSLLKNTSIRYAVVCDHSGAIHTTPELQLLTDSERGLLSENIQLEMDDSSTQETIMRVPPNNVALFRVSGFSWDGTFKSDGCPTESDGNSCPNSNPICSVSGQWPLDDGKSIGNFDRQTLRSQAHANEIAGRKLGMANNLYPEIRLKMHGNYFGIFDPSFPYYYTKIYNQSDTLRGFTITDKKSWLRNVTTTIDPQKGTPVTNIVLEVEIEELDGIFEECVLDFPNNSGESPTTGIIEDEDCGETLYTAGDYGFERFSNCTTPSYELTTDEPTYDMRVDPYHWSKIFRCGLGYIKHSEDYGTTWIDVTPQNPPNDAGDSPAPTSADLIFEHMDVSFPNEGEYVFLANWDQNRTWIVHTMDNGVTWDWEAIGGLSSGFGTTTSMGSIVENIGNCHMFPLDEYCFIAANTYADNTVRLIDSTGDVLNIVDDFITDSYLSILAQLTNTKFVIASIMPGNNLNLQILTVTGCTSMSVSLPLTVIGNVEMFSITALDLDKIAIATQDATTNHLTLSIYQVTTVFTLLDSIIFDNSGNGSLIHFYYFGTYTNGIVVNSIEIGVLRYHSNLDNHSGSELTRLKFDFSGGVLTTPDPPFILYNTTGEARSLKSVPLDSSHYIDVIGPSPYARLVNIDTPLVGLPSGVLNYPSTDSAGFVMQGDIIPYDTSQVLLLATNHTNQGDDPGSSAWLTMLEYDIPTLTLSLSPIEDATELVDKSSHRWGALMLRDVDSQIITMTGNLLKWNLTSYNAGSEGGVDIQDSLEGLGIALSRESANVIYLTLMDHTTSKLYTFTYDVPLAFNTNTVIKDGVTSQQLTDRTFWAFPVSDWFSDDICYIHGRFSHPDLLNHSIKTIDGGVTWLDNGANVGDDHISSLFVYLDGTQQIVRSKVSGVSQLYLVNGGVLNYRSNIPLLQWVNPHAQAVGRSGTYMGSWSPQSYMVSKTVYPLSEYRNYTYNHAIFGRLMSVEVLK